MNRKPSLKFNLIVMLFVIAGLLSGCDAQEPQPTAIPTETEDVLSRMMTEVASTLRTPGPSPTPTLDATLDWILEEIDYGKTGVYIIVEALNLFYADHGYYPEELSALVPNYLEQLPATITGEPFTYDLNDVDIFGVMFFRERRTGTYCGYWQNHEIWECGIINDP